MGQALVLSGALANILQDLLYLWADSLLGLTSVTAETVTVNVSGTKTTPAAAS